MVLLVDSREQDPLEFPKIVGVNTKQVALPVGDYGAEHNGVRDTTVFERKSIADLFASFTGTRYDMERKKIQLARELGLDYILAVESSASEILKGHAFRKDGAWQESKKSGLSLLRSLLTIMRKYGIQVWFFQTRREMAFVIQEYFFSVERAIRDESVQTWPDRWRQTPPLERGASEL